MASYQVKIRNGVHDQINDNKASCVITNYKVDKTYYPTSRLEDIQGIPEVKVVNLGMGAERGRELRNPEKKVLELGVMVHVQQRIDPGDTDRADLLVELVEDLMDLCEDDELVTGEKYSWLRTEPLKDENDLIYSYEALTVNGVFQAVFVLFYRHIHEE